MCSESAGILIHVFNSACVAVSAGIEQLTGIKCPADISPHTGTYTTIVARSPSEMFPVLRDISI